MIFIDLSTFLKALRTAFSGRWRSPRRIAWIVISIVAITVVYTVNTVGRLLDELFFPGYRKVEVPPPLIITANPRSGTTLLHRLLCHDEGSFIHLKLYHSLFPSITLYRIFGFFWWIDHITGRPFSMVIDLLNRIFFHGWDTIHGMGLGRAEEDEALFLFNFATPALYMLFPFFREVPELRFSDLLPEWKRRAIARYYLGSLKRFHYACGGAKRAILMKSVLFHSRMKMVMDIFPDAKVVYLMRHPYEALPSTINMFTAFWRVHSPDIPKDSEHTRKWARLCIDYYLSFHRNRHILDPSRFVTMLYSYLVKDPAGAVKSIYDTFGMTLAPEYAKRIDEAAARTNNFRSNHDYSLEEFGIEREWVFDAMKEIFDEYGLDR
ncbi:MAG: sulfotransferase [Chrysiogenales bacterium]|nr:MAG: sulfotransferase [Chrysiogenales bacterium]